MSDRPALRSGIGWTIAAISLAAGGGWETARASEAQGALQATLDNLQSLERQAQSLSASGAWSEAEATYRQILNIAASVPNANSQGVFNLRIKLAETIWNQARDLDGQQVASNAIDIAQHEKIDINTLMLAKLKLGRSYVESRKFLEAEAIVQETFEFTKRKTKFSPGFNVEASSIYTYVLLQQNRMPEAEAFLLQAISQARSERGDLAKPGLTFILLTAGEVYADQDNLIEADVAFSEALEIASTSESAAVLKPELMAKFVKNLANLGRLEEALTLGLRAEQEAQAAYYSKIDLARLTVAIARIRLLRLEYDQAKAVSKRAIAILSSQSSDKTVKLLLVDAYTTLLSVDIQQKRWTEAEYDASQIRTIVNEIYPSGLVSLNAEVARGYVIAMSGRVPEGEKLILSAKQKLIEQPFLSKNGLLNANIYLANARFQYAKSADWLTPAREGLQIGRAKAKIFEGTRGAGDAYSNDPSSLYGQESRGVYETFAEAAWRASQTRAKELQSLGSEALVALQEASVGPTSQAIMQATLRAVASQRGEGLGKLVSERQSLASAFATNESALAKLRFEKDFDTSLAKRLQTEQKQALARSEQIDLLIRQSFPDFAQFARPTQLDLKAVQALLAADEGLLFVVPTQFGTQSIAVTRTAFAWHRSEMVAERIGESVRRLLWDCGADVGVDAATAARWEAEGGVGYSYDRKTAYSLYQQLVAPVASTLAGKRKLYVVATDSLSSLPFGILLTQPPQGRDGDPQALRSSAWLADAFAITAVPTIQTLQLLKSRATTAASAQAADSVRFAGFGDPLLAKQGVSRGTRLTLRSTPLAKAQSDLRATSKEGGIGGRLKELSRLPGTATELEGIRQALGASPESVRLGARSTEAVVKDSDLSRVQVLAFATHGLMSGELYSGAEAGLVFTPPKKESVKDDGYLTASEIMNLRLNTDWVILSACNTAAGDGTIGASGLSGLARSFFYAGARNLLVSHWPVRDDVAEKITVEAIRLKRERPELSRPEALRLAMRKVRDDPSHDSPNDTWAHPNAWAPFSLVGDGG